jgi:hypothetical protein
MVSKTDNVAEEVAETNSSKTIETRSQTIDHNRPQVSGVPMSAKAKILIIDHPQIKVNEEAAIMTKGSQEVRMEARRATNIEVEGLKDQLEVEEGIGMISREKSPTRTKTTPLKIPWMTKKNKMKAIRTINLRDPMASIIRIEVAREVVVDAARTTNEGVHTTREILLRRRLAFERD